jgi:MoxR-like ATPase
MFTVTVGYPSEDEEFRVIESTTSSARPQVDRVVAADELLAMQLLVRKVPAAAYVIRYAMKLARLTRPHGQNGEPPDVNLPDFVRKYVTWGAGPRAGQNLILAAKARALLKGRPYVAIEDVKAVSLPVLRHRVITNYAARADNITTDELIRKLLLEVPAREA